MTSIVAWRSGFPFTVVSGQDNARTGQGSQRADLTGVSPYLSNDGHGAIAAQYLNQGGIRGECARHLRRAGTQYLPWPGLLQSRIWFAQGFPADARGRSSSSVSNVQRFQQRQSFEPHRHRHQRQFHEDHRAPAIRGFCSLPCASSSRAGCDADTQVAVRGDPLFGIFAGVAARAIDSGRAIGWIAADYRQLLRASGHRPGLPVLAQSGNAARDRESARRTIATRRRGVMFAGIFPNSGRIRRGDAPLLPGIGFRFPCYRDPRGTPLALSAQP